jgi:hypothetical protein
MDHIVINIREERRRLYVDIPWYWYVRNVDIESQEPEIEPQSLLCVVLQSLTSSFFQF